LFASIWAIVYVAFFSLISGKRAGYILPIAPALGILAAWYVAGHGAIGPKAAVARLWVHRIAFGVLLLLSVVLVAATALACPILVRVEEDPGLLKEALERLTPAWHVCAILFLLPAAVACIGLVRAVKGRHINDYFLATAVFVLMAVGQPCVGWAANVFKSGRLFCQEAMPYIQKARVVNLFPQDYSGVYNLYTGIVSMPVITEADALREALNRPGTVVIGERSRLLKDFTSEELAPLTLMERNVGHREMLLLGRLQPAAAHQGDAARTGESNGTEDVEAR